MIRFKLVDEEAWDRSESHDEVYICVEFDPETNKEITKQLCNGNEPEDLRACWIELAYNIEEESLRFYDVALEEFDLEDGKSYSKPFGNDSMVYDITLELNDEEIDYVEENLDRIIAQIIENENIPYEPREENEWDYDYLR